MTPIVDPIITILLEKLSDGNPRIREGAKRGLDCLIKLNSVGCPSLVQQLLKPLSGKTKTGWRPLCARLQLINELVNSHGSSPSSGLLTDSILSFLKANNAFSHGNVEVRDIAKELVVSIQISQLQGHETVESFLKSVLRPKQLEEYDSALEAALGLGGGGHELAEKRPVVANSKTNDQENVNKNKKESKSSPRSNPGQGSPPRSKPQNSSPPKSTKSKGERIHEEKSNAKELEKELPGDFTCTFCNAGDSHWTEDDLDYHFLKDCPLLSPCPACNQVAY
jgi:hypothetical protein